jgi:hypothetical protein
MWRGPLVDRYIFPRSLHPIQRRRPNTNSQRSLDSWEHCGKGGGSHEFAPQSVLILKIGSKRAIEVRVRERATMW